MTSRFWGGVALGCAAVIGSGFLFTASADANGNTTIKACANKVNGNLRLASECRASEEQVTWNVRGPAGPAGPSALSVTMRSATRTFTVDPVASGHGPNGVGAGCQVGETALSGGLTNFGSSLLPLRLLTTGPSFDGTRSGWTMDWVNPTNSPVTATVTMTVLCAPGAMTLAR